MSYLTSRPWRILCGLLLAALAFVVLADFEAAFCNGESAGRGCGAPVAGQGSEREDQCDHCAACVISHGHLTSLAPERIPASRLLPSLSIGMDLPASPSDLWSHEVFHPPLLLAR